MAGNNRRMRLHASDLAMPADDTEYFLDVPEGAKCVVIKLADSNIEWRYSTVAGAIATPGAGIPMDGNQELDLADCEFSKQRLYFAHTAGVAQTLKHSWMYPVGAR